MFKKRLWHNLHAAFSVLEQYPINVELYILEDENCCEQLFKMSFEKYVNAARAKFIHVQMFIQITLKWFYFDTQWANSEEYVNAVCMNSKFHFWCAVKKEHCADSRLNSVNAWVSSNTSKNHCTTTQTRQNFSINFRQIRFRPFAAANIWVFV